MIAYLVFTTLYMLFTYVKLQNPESMLWWRFRVIAITGAMWLIYRMIPCRLMRLLRIAVQMMLLSWWYPDTYELNRILPNLDHFFAAKGAAALWMPAVTALLATLPQRHRQRADEPGLYVLLPSHTRGHHVLLPVPLRTVHACIVYHTQLILRLLRRLYLPACSRTTVLLPCGGARPDSTRHLPQPARLFLPAA